MNNLKSSLLLWTLFCLLNPLLTEQQAAFKQLNDANVACTGTDYVSYSNVQLGLDGSNYSTFTYSFWWKTPNTIDRAQLPANQNLILSRFNSMPENGDYNRLMIQYEYATSTYDFKAFVNEAQASSMTVPAVTTQLVWNFFSQTIDYNTNIVHNYYYYPGQATSAAVTGIVRQTLSIASGTVDTVLDDDVLYIGGAPDAYSLCGYFARIFVVPTTSSATIPDIEALRLGSKDILYVTLIQFYEFRGQTARSTLSNFQFALGSDAANEDVNDPTWDRTAGGLTFSYSGGVTQYISLNTGVYLVYAGAIDFTFEWEISINTQAAFQFLQKGPLLISYTETRALSVTVISTTKTFEAPISLRSGFNDYRLYCSKYSRPTVFCHLWINEQDQGEIIFPSETQFIDSPANAIVIPPSTSGEYMFQGTLKRFLIALNRTTIYPIDSMSDCLYAFGGTICYKVNPNNFDEFTCPSRTYLDNVSYTCAACPLGCEVCVNNTLYGCTKCLAGYVDVNGYCGCGISTYFNTALGACSSCIEGCDNCTNSADCLLCSVGYYLDSTLDSSGTCVQTCPSGYFGNDITRTCDIITCPANCLLCPSSDTCTKCKTTHVLENGVCTTYCSSANPINFNGSCHSSCPQGYFNHNQQGYLNTCVICDPNCLTCSGPTNSECLSCHSGRFLQNDKCLSCNSSCETCSMDANNCTYCRSGTYLLESTCVSVCPDTVNEANRSCVESATNLGCLPPMASTSTGDCVFCRGNCAECSSDAQTCIICNPGLTLQNGVCTIPGSQSSVTFQAGTLKNLGALSLGLYSTSQDILAELSEDVLSINVLKVFWILFAKDIAPDYANLSCSNIQEIVSNNYTQAFSASILQIGTHGLGYINYTNSYGIYLRITGLRAALNYNFTLCTQQPTVSTKLWDSGTIEFTTKNNGYAIRKAKLTLDTDLPSEDFAPFLCALASDLSVNNSVIITSDGYSCNSENARRLLDYQSHEKLNRRTLTATSTNKLDLLIYGDPTSETFDSSTSEILDKLTSQSFMDSFVYTTSSATASSKGIVRITEMSIGQSIIPEAPVIVTETVSYEVKGNIMFFPNITFSGVDGYAYICLVPNNSQTDIAPPSSALIISSMKPSSQSTDDYIIEKIRFYNGEALAVIIEGINPNTSYNIVIFGTNEDQSSFAFRTPRLIMQAILGTTLPKLSIELSYFTLIATEVGAVVFLIITWVSLFTKINIKLEKCIRYLSRRLSLTLKRLLCFRSKKSQDEQSKIHSSLNKKDPSSKYQIRMNISWGTVVELQCDETTRQFVNSPRKSVNASTICNERIEIGSERVLGAESTSLSSSNIALQGGLHFPSRRAHIVDLSLLEVPDEDQEAREAKFEVMTTRKQEFQFMKP